MATVKVTFTLDEETVSKLNQTAARLAKPKSEVVRAAIADYHEKSGRLSEEEKQRLLAALKAYMAQPPTRSQAEADREIEEIRRARRAGGRLHRYD